jgi:integrase
MPRLDKESEVRKAIADAKTKLTVGKRDVLVFDGGHKGAIPGFGLRVFESGAASFILKFAIKGGPTRRVSLGDARLTEVKDGKEVPGNLHRKRKWAGEIRDTARVLGRDIFAEREAEEAAKLAAKQESEDAPTLRKLALDYLRDRERGRNENGRELKKLKARSHTETARYLTGSKRTPAIWEPISGVPLSRIAMRQLQDVLEETAKSKGSVTADRARVALSGFFSWAIELGHVDANPTNDLAAYSLNKPRERTLTETELVDVWRACLDDEFGKIVKLLMLTGCRRAEIGDLSWPEIDLEKRRIELPPQRTKNGREHLIPLSDEALAILKSIPRSNTRTLVFGWGAGGYSGWSKSKAELDDRIASAGAKPTKPWVLHDLRRSVVTHLLESRERTNKKGEVESYAFAQPHVVEAIVNHVSGHKGGVAGVYNKAAYYAEKREALQRWASHLTRLLSAPRANQRVSKSRRSARAVAGAPAA